MPPRIGSARCSVASRLMESSERVLSLDVRCLPACTRRMSDDGRFVRRARRDFSVEMDVVIGTVSGIALDDVSVQPSRERQAGDAYCGRRRP